MEVTEADIVILVIDDTAAADSEEGERLRGLGHPRA